MTIDIQTTEEKLKKLKQIFVCMEDIMQGSSSIEEKIENMQFFAQFIVHINEEDGGAFAQLINTKAKSDEKN